MATSTLTKYAVQVRWPDGSYSFVVDGHDSDKPRVHYSLEDARIAASIWAPGSTRIVASTAMVHWTDWEEVP